MGMDTRKCNIPKQTTGRKGSGGGEYIWEGSDAETTRDRREKMRIGPMVSAILIYGADKKNRWRTASGSKISFG